MIRLKILVNVERLYGSTLGLIRMFMWEFCLLKALWQLKYVETVCQTQEGF